MKDAQDFELKLKRLKLSLGVIDDQEAAAALGISKTALSLRKSRGAFPTDKVFALAGSRPDLELDVHYILTGQHSAGTLGLGVLALSTATASSPALGQPAGKDYMRVLAALEKLSPESLRFIAERVEELALADTLREQAVARYVAAVVAPAGKRSKTDKRSK